MPGVLETAPTRERLLLDGDFYLAKVRCTLIRGGVRCGGIRYLPIFGRYFGNLNKKWTVFCNAWWCSPGDDGKAQFLIENTTVTIFIQIFHDAITVIFEKNQR